ncbi:2,3-butanediol dehydrogenase [Amaricoccus macauensis]|uniref:2,3-butanediol dehydrogenase n=1 Tax=Amaricoccus macauensis TaxID=57001 RepID=UPI003C7E55C9
MKALRFHGAKDLRIEDVDKPASPGPGQVLVRNTHCGICGSDLHEYSYGPIFIPQEPHVFTGAKLPQIMGHEFGGVVEAIGPGVGHVAVGDRVSCQPIVTPRAGEYHADRGLFQLSDRIAIVGLSHDWGGMAEYALLDDYNVAKVPDELADEAVALIEPTAVGVYACDRGEVTAGSSVLVTGAGPIGVVTLMAARAAGATRLFLSDPNDTRLELAKSVLPEVVTINPTRESVADAVHAATEASVGCDTAIECVGNEHALKDCLSAVRKQGIIVQCGLHPGEGALDWFQVTFKDVQIRGSWTYGTHFWPRVAKLISTGMIPDEKLVTRRIALEDAVRDGFDALLDPAGDQLKIIIEI